MQLHYGKIAWLIAPRLSRTDFVLRQETSPLSLRVSDWPWAAIAAV
jgi:hypothetical protein